MKLRILILAGVLCSVHVGCAKNKDLVSEPPSAERGKKLVMVGSCNDCHSPKTMTPQGPIVDEGRLLSGFPQQNVLPEYKKNSPWLLFTGDLTAVVGPWGVSFARNLTPDPDTGLGTWTSEQFVQTIRNQKHLGNGRAILPPMAPIMKDALAVLSDDELKDIFAYLKSLKPVKNKVPEPVLF